jgi:hypothetical protein
MSPKKIALAITVYASLLEGVAEAQGLSTIVGTITDASGAVVPDAKITITQTSTGVARTASADTQGYYVVPSLRPTVYNVTVEAPGFRKFNQPDITLRADQSLTLNLRLDVGDAAEAVTVVATAPLVDSYTPTLRQVVDQQRIVELPLNGRNAADLVTLVPGVVVDSGAGNDADQGNTKTFPSAVTISTNGSRQNAVSFYLDGANNLDQFTNVNMPFPFPDALQEFSVQTSNYSARYGQNGGAVVNVVTKSGSNALHGDAFEFVRNRVFNARNAFASDRDALKRNQFGGTIGGPVVIPHIYDGKNRTFFFAGAQGTTTRSTFGTRSAFVPTDANLRGDFSSLLNASNPFNIAGRSIQLVDPITKQPFVGNQIPPSMFDPASLNLVNKYLPRSGGSGLIFYPSRLKENMWEMVGRLDQAVGTSDRLFFRYFGAHFEHFPGYQNNNLLTDDTASTIFSQNYAIDETHIFRPNLLNTFNFSFARVASARGAPPDVPSVRDLGVNLYQPPERVGINSLSVSRYFEISNSVPASFIRNTFTWTDDVNWLKGRHNFSFGGQFSRARLDINNFFRTPGVFAFSGDATGDAMADFLLGRLRTFRQGNGQYGRNRAPFLGMYAHDTFRLTSRLNLDMGIRWDPWFAVREIRGRVLQFRPDAFYRGERTSQYTNALPGEFFPGDPGFPENGQMDSLKHFAPRLGFAYDLTGDGKTSLRGGGGVFNDSRSVMTTNWEMLNNSPFSPQFSLTNPKGPFSNPLAGYTNPFPAPFPPPKDAAFPVPALVVANDPSGRFRVPTSYQWNLTIERQFVGDWLFRAAYVGSHTSHLRESIELNPAVYIPGSNLGPDERRIFNGYADIYIATQQANSSYNSLQLTAEKRLSHGYSVLANYTWAKSLDNLPWAAGVTSVGGDSGFSVLPWNFPNSHALDRGPSEFDRTHVFVVSTVWELPRLADANHFVRTAVGGWQLSGILQAQSGAPLTLLSGTDTSGTALGQDRAQYLGGQARVSGPCATETPCRKWLNPAVFGLPSDGSFGNSGKGNLRGPGALHTDLGIYKNFAATERLKLQLRGEFFNVLNHVNPGDPNNYLGGGFGQIYSAGSPRITQLALKVLF